MVRGSAPSPARARRPPQNSSLPPFSLRVNRLSVPRFRFPARRHRSWLPLTLAALLLPLAPAAPLRAQMLYDTRNGEPANTSDPSKMYVDAYSAALQAEKLEEGGNLKPALAKYRFAASLLDQLSQTNPNWQPLIVGYRLRKTIASIRALEDKGVVLAGPAPGAGDATPAVPGAGNSYGRPAVLPAQPVGPDDDLPAPDLPPGAVPGNAGRVPQNAAVVTPQGPLQPPASLAAPLAPPGNPEALAHTAQQLKGKLDKTQKELKDALDGLATARKEKQDIAKEKDNVEYQLQSSRSEVKLAQRRFERTKANRDSIENDLGKAQARLKDATAKNPAVAQSRKDLRDEVEELKKQLAKAQADNEVAAKSRDDVSAKFDASERNVAQLTKERDAAVARNELTKDAAQKIESLQTENASLGQKLSSAESSITKLTAESRKKKQELDSMSRELTTMRDQLASSRDQNDRNATTITELRAQLDTDAKRIDELKAKGMTSEEYAKLNKENEMLRGIVMRQLKDQARRASVKKLLADELARLDVQNSALNTQLEELGRPATQLSDEERALFKEPLVTMAESSTPDSTAAVISAYRSRKAPGADASQPPGADNPPEEAGNQPPGGEANGAAKGSGPQVQTSSQPRVSEELLPLAREAKDSFDRGRYVDSELAYEKLLARDPKNSYLLANQGLVLLRQDKLKRAEVTLKRAVTSAPHDAFSQWVLGVVYYRMHRYDEATNCLTQSLTLDPKNPMAHNYLGITASQKGYPEMAAAEIEKAIALSPEYADAHFNLAVVYATQQPPDKARAREHYDAAVRLGANPDQGLEKLVRN